MANNKKSTESSAWNLTRVTTIISVLIAMSGWYLSYRALSLNTKTFETSYRPYVGLVGSHTKFTDKFMMMQFTFKNVGNVPAKAVKVNIDMIYPKEDGNTLKEHMQDNFILFPSCSFGSLWGQTYTLDITTS